MKISIKDTGIIERLKLSVCNKVDRSANKGIEKALEGVKTSAMQETPVDTGKLRSSFRISKDSQSKGIKYTLKNDTEYAVYVHEILTNYHPVGKAKYLEDPVYEHIDNGKLLRAIADSIKGGL